MFDTGEGLARESWTPICGRLVSVNGSCLGVGFAVVVDVLKKSIYFWGFYGCRKSLQMVDVVLSRSEKCLKLLEIALFKWT